MSDTRLKGGDGRRRIAMAKGKRAIPVIDIFAGPGGLGEGFVNCTVAGQRPFSCALSIEKDHFAHQTLQLRSFYRQFKPGEVHSDYYRYLRGEITRGQLFDLHPAEAEAASQEAWKAELGETPHAEVRDRINRALAGRDDWVLIGGPPCQAYSIVGRSRNKGIEDYKPDEDKKQTLYREYLQIIADHWPKMFVMENVKGLLSATLKDQRIFDRIVTDLSNPAAAVGKDAKPARSGGPPYTYTIRPIGSLEEPDPTLFNGVPKDLHDFVVHCERYGVPQARHRVILLGIRSDVKPEIGQLRKADDKVGAGKVLSGLPRLRSGLSSDDGGERWLDLVASACSAAWLKDLTGKDAETVARVGRAVDHLRRPQNDRGDEFISYDVQIEYEPDWYLDDKIGGICNHITREHMDSDLHRYLFVAAFGEAHGRSPVLDDFPKALLPKHDSVEKAKGSRFFADRFRVQLKDRPATTITSHMAKDGHYFIHYDPTQCRSLTVREAARLQTFPDNYFFCGPRTAQYTQVGNAVPPYVARQIAEIVANLLA